MSKDKEPVYLTQKDDKGYDEKVDVSINSHMVVCEHPGCTEIRYVKPQDKSQVKFCKPHAYEHKKKYRAAFMRNRRSQ